MQINGQKDKIGRDQQGEEQDEKANTNGTHIDLQLMIKESQNAPEKYASHHIIFHACKGANVKWVVHWYRYAPAEDTIDR